MPITPRKKPATPGRASPKGAADVASSLGKPPKHFEGPTRGPKVSDFSFSSSKKGK